MDDRFKESPGILHHGSICFEIDGDRSPVDVVGVRATVCRPFGEHGEFTITLMLPDDRFESFTFFLELALQFLECRRG